MYVVECIPFSKSLNRETLSYFSSKKVDPGAIVKVSLRNKTVPALVMGSRSVSAEKANIKSADFSLKKIESFHSSSFLNEKFIQGVKECADYFATSTGAILSSLLPQSVLAKPSVLLHLKNRPSYASKDKSEEESKPPLKPAALQATYEDRLSLYKSAIRSEFAKKKSIFFCFPQNENIRRSKEKLERGIEEYVCTFHDQMSQKEIEKEIKRALNQEHGVIVLASSQWLFLPRNDWGMVIMDGENKSGWNTFERPYIDLRVCIEKIASSMGAKVVLGDSVLRIETLWRYKKDMLEEFGNIKWRLESNAKSTIINQVKNSKEVVRSDKEEKDFSVISPELQNSITRVIEEGSHAFLYATRKGLSSVIICRDCGSSVVCNNCESPMILHKSKGDNIFRCHQCGETRGANEVCKICRGWRLASFGSGVERVVEEIKNKNPKAKVFELHRDVVSTSSRAHNIMERFYDSNGAILVGTELALSYIHKKVDLSAIVTLDSLFSIPDYRIREKIFRLITDVKDASKKVFLMQTRNTSDDTVDLAVTGNTVDFFKNEIDDRQMLFYPPFSIFIKISARGSKKEVPKFASELERVFKDYSPVVFPSLYERRGEQTAVNCVIKLPREEWPDKKLSNLLRLLPPYFETKVDPDNLL